MSSNKTSSSSSSSSSSAAAATATAAAGKNEWTPYLNMTNRMPTSECLKRIRTDMKSLTKDPLLGIYFVPDETYNTVLHALIIGPFDTPYEGGFFYFLIDCPDNYPHEPPKVTLMTTGGGRVRFNPNLYANGKVCLSILGTWSGPGWASVNSLSSVLLSIQSLLNEKPYHNEPGFESTNMIDCSNYSECIRHETLRVAVCEMANADSQLPEKLKSIVRSLFVSFFETYDLTCTSNLRKNGQTMVDPFLDQRGCFQYDKILTRINEINETLMHLHHNGDDGENEENGDDGEDCDGDEEGALKSEDTNDRKRPAEG